MGTKLKYVVFFAVAMLLMDCATVANENAHTSPLYNANVVALGDSNTWYGGDNCDNDLAWTKWFKSFARPASCRSFARSGASWTNTTSTVANTTEDIAVLGDNNVIYNQVLRLIDACDNGMQVVPQLIIIAAGANDAWFEAKRPGAYSIVPADVASVDTAGITLKKPSQVLTLAETVIYNCKLLNRHLPDATIVLVTPAQATKVSDELINRTGDIIETAGKMLGIKTIRLDKLSSLSSKQESQKHVLTTDGVHTSARGAKLHGKIIADRVKVFF